MTSIYFSPQLTKDLLEAFKQQKPAYFENGCHFNFDDELRHFLKVVLTPETTARKYNDNAFPCLKVIHNGSKIDKENWGEIASSSKEHFYSKPGALLKSIELKCSLILDEYSRHSTIAQQACSFIQKIIPCRSSCNAYFSQQGGKGFPAHSDSHHVVVIAISGIKEWIIYKEKKHPLSAQYRIETTTDNKANEHRTVLQSIEMQPGDMLFIPQGQYHEVNNLTNNALHLTCCIRQQSCVTFLNQLIERTKFCDQLNLSCEALAALAQPHPYHLDKQTITASEAIPYLESLIPALKEVAHDKDFLDVASEPYDNKLLTINELPFENIIEEILTNS
jgi:hypothetical protein